MLNIKGNIRRLIRFCGAHVYIPALQPKVKSVEETFQYIIDNKVSVSRFGDGELKRAIGRRHDAYKEVPDQNMRRRLREVIKSDLPNHIVCVQNVFHNDLSMRTPGYQRFWHEHMGIYRLAWHAIMKQGKIYYSTEISRCYLSYMDKRLSQRDFSYWKEIWKNRNVLLIEGDKTGVGAGNDLLEGAKSIRRIIVPAENAYKYYDEILQAAKRHYCEGDLILIAAGATATILAYDLARCNCQAIDLGHVDVEYEWYIHKAPGRTVIPGKYVNEMKEFGGIDVIPNYGQEYENQVVERIGIK